jgi:hypothetical protein
MLSRFLSCGLVVVGVALLAFVGLDYFACANASRIVVEEPHRDILVTSPGEQDPLPFVFQNLSAHPVQVVGMTVC